ncbi:hypothetical protein SESBI_25777 [Sesbania bispinosa]|nr:hypothetical protein SESBI_25777 [Sesbania bispinosa]
MPKTDWVSTVYNLENGEEHKGRPWELAAAAKLPHAGEDATERGSGGGAAVAGPRRCDAAVAAEMRGCAQEETDDHERRSLLAETATDGQGGGEAAQQRRPKRTRRCARRGCEMEGKPWEDGNAAGGAATHATPAGGARGRAAVAAHDGGSGGERQLATGRRLLKLGDFGYLIEVMMVVSSHGSGLVTGHKRGKRDNGSFLYFMV